MRRITKDETVKLLAKATALSVCEHGYAESDKEMSTLLGISLLLKTAYEKGMFVDNNAIVTNAYKFIDESAKHAEYLFSQLLNAFINDGNEIDSVPDMLESFLFVSGDIVAILTYLLFNAEEEFE